MPFVHSTEGRESDEQCESENYSLRGRHLGVFAGARRPRRRRPWDEPRLRQNDFTGRVESTLPGRLGRRIEDDLANLGRLLWFDNVHSLHRDNTCAGCHLTARILRSRVDNSGLCRFEIATGPRNQRAHAARDKHRVLPEADVERPLLRQRRSGKSLATSSSSMFGFTFPAPEVFPRHPTDASHSADRTGRGRRLHRHVVARASRSSTTARGWRFRGADESGSAIIRFAWTSSRFSTGRGNYGLMFGKEFLK